jgi:phenylpropionate dioxygenase-like ring-hydroxylating dioxygenase large terminal subunit
VPNPDDFYVSRMGEESVILTRDRQGKLHVFLNSCRHRGMKLCRHDEGNTRVFSCPYHAWSYSTDGALVSTPGELFGVPGYKKYYHEELDKKEWGLAPVAQMVNYRGTIWATWDRNAAPFEDYLGSMRLWLDSALDHRDGRAGGSTLLVGVQKWRTNCNWKFPATTTSSATPPTSWRTARSTWSTSIRAAPKAAGMNGRRAMPHSAGPISVTAA